MAAAGGLLGAVTRRLPHLERLVVHVTPIGEGGLEAVQNAGFVLSEATHEALDRLLPGVRKPHQIEPLHALLRRGIRGWIATADGQFAGHAFLVSATDRPIRFGGVRLYPGEMAITAMFVNPVFRGRGLGAALHRQLEAIAVRDDGARVNVAWTADYNVASRRMLARLGCQPVGTIRRLIVWHRPLVSVYRGAPPRR